MTVEMNTEEQGGDAFSQPVCLLTEPSPVQRTAAEKMLILAHLTVALIELDVEERRIHGNA